MDELTADQIRTAVRQAYGKIAIAEANSCCGPAESSCCSPGPAQNGSVHLGYTDDDLAAAPAGSDLGLGCGNPQAIASLKPGEIVLDLGSGAGFDAFLAARQVGPAGRVIGVDMTPEMVTKARTNALGEGYDNVEFRLGEIERLPVADQSVDVIISNCVINLSPDKPSVFAEAYRVLKPGGRLAISDVVAFADLPDELRNDLGLHSGCVAGASALRELEDLLTDAGFQEVRIEPKSESAEFIRDWVPGQPITDYVLSATIIAVRPKPGPLMPRDCDDDALAHDPCCP